MSRTIYISYKGDEHAIGAVGHGIDAHCMAVALDDIVEDMRGDYVDTAEVTISIR